MVECSTLQWGEVEAWYRVEYSQVESSRDMVECSLVPRPLSEKLRRGLATRSYIALSRADCRVRANQIAVFGYVTLIAT